MADCDCGSEHPPLETLIEFPCDYHFKAFGPNDADFVAAVRRAAGEVLPIPLDCIKTRPSGQGSYQCVTVLARVHNADQIRGIYAALHRIETLKYLL